MTAIGLLMVGAGVLLVWAGVSDVNVMDEIRAALTTGHGLPAKGGTAGHVPPGTTLGGGIVADGPPLGVN